MESEQSDKEIDQSSHWMKAAITIVASYGAAPLLLAVAL